MKRAFSLFLALAMLFSLAACSQQEPETSPTGSSNGSKNSICSALEIGRASWRERV